jgi:hypothetical protein
MSTSEVETASAVPDNATLAHPERAATILGVTPQALQMWADAGLLTVYHTPSGHPRYLWSEILALLRNALLQNTPPTSKSHPTEENL